MLRTRAGFALIEVLVAGVLAMLVLAAAALMLQGQSRLAQHTSARSETNDAMRSALMTLRAELQPLAPAFDLRAFARDSIASRIFRGVGVVCGYRPGSTFMRYEGLRLPDPAKDSMLQIGIENRAALIGVSAADDACPHNSSAQVLALTLTEPATIGSMWLVYESGAYHLSTNALRYRRGVESRQPITGEVINDRASGFVVAPDSLVRAVGVQLRSRAGNTRAREQILLLNHQ
jgi:hypothetical protein